MGRKLHIFEPADFTIGVLLDEEHPWVKSVREQWKKSGLYEHREQAEAEAERKGEDPRYERLDTQRRLGLCFNTIFAELGLAAKVPHGFVLDEKGLQAALTFKPYDHEKQ